MFNSYFSKKIEDITYLIKNEKFHVILAIIFLSFLPATLLMGSAIINVFSVCIIIFFTIDMWKGGEKFPNDIFFYLLLIFWLSLIINLIFSNYLWASLPRSIGFGKFILFVFSIKYFFTYKKFKFEKIILKSWLVIFCVVSADLLIEYFFGSNTLGFKGAMPGRLSGFLNQELKIGNFYYGFILISICTMHYHLQIKNKNTYIILFIILFLTISLIIGERANFIKVIFTSLLFIIFSGIDLKKKFLIFGSIFLFIVLLLKFENNFNTRIIGQVSNPIISKGYINYLNYIQHGAHRDAARLIFKDNLFFGSGVKTFRYESAKEKYKNKEYKKTSWRISTHPHQIHWEFISETGIFGYSIFLIFFFLVIVHSVKKILKNKNLFALSSLLFIIATILPLIPSGSFFTTYTATIFWLNFAILSIYKEKK